MTIDIEAKEGRPAHQRIEYVTGSSTAFTTFTRVKDSIGPDDRVLVILDSDHSAGHVLAEMFLYGPLVSSGSYLVVEDSNINGHPVLEDWGPGPMEAIAAFLPTQQDFVIDRGRERLLLSFNPRGYLRKR